jgi:tRNA A-37 threonylcarbamoyl transferase component Bud32
MLSRFKKEFRIVQGVDHPNLVMLDELIEDDGAWFFTMELVEGVDLLSHVRGEAVSSDELPDTELTPYDDTLRAERLRTTIAAPALNVQRLRDTLRQLAVGLHAIHSAGFIHRDIKPTNIMVTPEGLVVILDFGLTTYSEVTHQSMEGHTVGTAAYMAPEQAVAKPLTVAADWYAVGALLYEALTGQLPFDGPSFQVLMQKQHYEPRPIHTLIPQVPHDLDMLCAELLRVEPEARPSGEAILERLGIQPSPLTVQTATTTPFVGREHELSRLYDGARATRFQPVVSIVRGESGLGKSALVQHFTDMVVREEADAVVLRGRCYERESVSYKGLDGVADALGHYLSGLPPRTVAELLPDEPHHLSRLFPVLARVDAIGMAPRLQVARSPQESRLLMFSALRELLTNIAARQPLVLVIDDLQWTDVDTLTLLQEVLAHADAPRLHLIATMRPILDPARQQLFTVIESLAREHIISLTSLPDPAATALAHFLLPDADESSLRAVVAEAAGHPLFLQELARGIDLSGAVGVASLEETLWGRISELAQGPRRVLEVVSVAGTPISVEVAARAAGIDHPAYLEAARALRVGCLARSEGVGGGAKVGAYHDRIGEVVLGHLSEETLRRHHEQLAIALEATGAARTAPHTLIRHAEAAGDTARAAEYAEAAAHHAVEVMAFDRAATLFESALRHKRVLGAEVGGVQLNLARSLANAGRGREAAEAFVAAGAFADSAGRIECAREAAEQWLFSGHVDKGLQAMSRLLAGIGVRLPDTPRRAVTSLLWTRARLRLRGLRWKEVDPSEISPAERTRIDLYKAASHGLAAVDVVLACDFQSRGLLAALKSGDRFRVARAFLSEAIFTSFQGGPRRIARSRALADEAAPLVGDDPYLMAWQACADVAVGYFSSRFRAAAEAGPSAEVLTQRLAGTTWELSSVRLFRLWALLRLGSFATMASLLDEYLRDATRRGDLYTYTTMVRSCHIIWLARGDIDEAERVLDDAHWAPSPGRYHLQHWFAYRARAEIELYRESPDPWTGALDGFAELERSLLMRNITVRCEARWLRGRLALAAVGSAGDAGRKLIAEARKMARKLEGERDVFATASALLLRAAIATRCGDAASAIEILRGAVEAAEGGDLMMHATCARWRLGELLGDDEGRLLRSQAGTWMREQGIVEPNKLVEVVSPGFAGGEQ